jgi:hypothetical protein
LVFRNYLFIIGSNYPPLPPVSHTLLFEILQHCHRIGEKERTIRWTNRPSSPASAMNQQGSPRPACCPVQQPLRPPPHAYADRRPPHLPISLPHQLARRSKSGASQFRSVPASISWVGGGAAGRGWRRDEGTGRLGHHRGCYFELA